MIRLFISDLDGCISFPFRPPPLGTLAELVELHGQRKSDACIPPLTLCTGRPMTYAEAVAQWLAVDRPFLFESGSGMYDPVANRVTWSPHLTDTDKQALAELRQVVHTELAERYPGTIAEIAKRFDVGLVNPDTATIQLLRAAIEELVAGYSNADLEIHHTPISVNVIPRAANKGAGIAWLAAQLGISLDEVAYMGDSGGDVSALTRAAMPFAPANAAPEAKAVATVLRGEATEGLLEAYRAVIAHNRQA